MASSIPLGFDFNQGCTFMSGLSGLFCKITNPLHNIVLGALHNPFRFRGSFMRETLTQGHVSLPVWCPACITLAHSICLLTQKKYNSGDFSWWSCLLLLLVMVNYSASTHQKTLFQCAGWFSVNLPKGRVILEEKSAFIGLKCREVYGGHFLD